MKIWEKHGMGLQAEKWGKESKFSLFCTDPQVYTQIPDFPAVLEQGISLEEPNKFFLPFNASMHLLTESGFLNHLKSQLPEHHEVLDYYFLHDLKKILAIMFSAPLENAQAHAHKFDREKVASCSVLFKEQGEDLLLRVQVQDEGPGFDWKHVVESYKSTSQSYHGELGPNPHLKDVFSHAQGTALYALLGMCDEVRFNESGNCITLTKKLSL